MRKSLWTAAIILAAVFLLEGILKFLPSTVTMFGSWGYPAWFAYVIGVIEILCAVLLLFPRFTVQASMVLALVMAGAFFTLLRAGEPVMSVVPFALLIYCVLLAYTVHKKE